MRFPVPNDDAGVHVSEQMVFDALKPQTHEIGYPALREGPRDFATFLRHIHFGVTALSELPCGQYTWAYVKNSTRAERLCCSFSVALLAICVALAVYFGVYYNTALSPLDDEDWYIPRTEWLAEAYDNDDIQTEYEPVRLVVIQHTAGAVCYTFQKCCTEVRNLQNWFINKKDRDIPYNFLIGNDGRVYEGRSWHKEGAYLIGYNRCSVGIGFMGDYREEIKGYTKVTESQQRTLHKILDEGIKLGYLHPDYKVIAAKDLQNDPAYQSPGSNLYNAMQKWPHFDDGKRFKNKNCSQITAMAFP
ncbi:N-acetylmuramoyl-L-alanine amidase domain-containing protein [Phthorimaea operculella]|nr:N-acetylmuramoyl-L-alanine amidase domain-containing protein [Phthorimaea operculella]